MAFFKKDIGKATLVICVVICVFGIILLKNIDTGFQATQDSVGDLVTRMDQIERRLDKAGAQQQTPEAEATQNDDATEQAGLAPQPQQPDESGMTAADQSDGGVKEDGYIFVYFGAEWCPYCPQMEPIYEELKEEYSDQMEFMYIDIDEHPDLAFAYGATSVPTFALITSEGDFVDAQVGATTKAKLENLIERNI